MKKHINSISCGQGAPSTFLIIASGHFRIFPAEVVIVADTGGENDMLWSTGERTNARRYFDEVVLPLAKAYGMDAYFHRAGDKHGNPLPDIMSAQSVSSYDIPMFGSNGGRAKQSCTSKWKIAAINQKLRLLGATSATVNLGITMDEVHRIRQSNLKWVSKEYPLVMGERKFYKSMIIEEMNKFGVPYLISTECDFCPHKNYARWQRSSAETIQDASIFEEKFHDTGLYLTDRRIPLVDAIEDMKNKKSISFDDMCGEYCFI